MKQVSPSELYRLALDAKIRKNGRPPGVAYAPTIEVLRRSGYGWDEVEEWFKAHGLNFSQKYLRVINKRWGKTDAYLEWIEAYEPDLTAEQMLAQVSSL